MSRFEEKLAVYQGWVLFFMVALTLVSLLRHIGDVGVFFTVLGLHLFFGQAVYSYVKGRTIFMGGAIGYDASVLARRSGAVVAIVCFFMVFLF